MSGGVYGSAVRLKRKKPSKYKNVQIREDGIVFDSLREHKRYMELRLLRRAGEIENFIVHPRYPLLVDGQKICIYEADFCYSDVKTGVSHVEDVKGARTALYILKRKLMRACLNIDVEEIK